MLPKFELYMPDTMEEACRLKAEGAEVVAGGTDVFVNMHGGKDRSEIGRASCRERVFRRV